MKEASRIFNLQLSVHSTSVPCH